MNLARGHQARALALGVIAVTLVSAFSGLRGQTAAAGQSLAPAREGLRPIPLPDLSKLEAPVAEQIRSLQETFASLGTQPNLGSGDLAAAYGDLGNLYHAYEFMDAAESSYLNAASLTPSDYRWPHLLGRLREAAGRLEEASESYKATLKLRPGSVATLVHQGAILLQLNQPKQASHAFESAVRINPNEAAAHDGLGRLKLAEGKLEEAVKHFERALKLVPAANRIHYSLGMAYRGMGDLKSARTHLDQRGAVGVRAADPLVDELQLLLQGERVHLLQGRLAFSAGRFQQAARSFSEAVKGDPKSARARVNLGTALGQLGEIQGAIEQFRAALEIDRQNVTAHFNLGTLYVRSNKHAQAVDHLLFVVGKRPEDLEAVRELAKTLLHLGRNDEALEYLPRVVNSNPNDEDPRLALARLWVRGKQYRQAHDLLSKAYERLPGQGRTAHALARLLASCPDVSLRDGDRAVEIASRVFRASPSASHAETLALALAQQGSCPQAAKVQEKVVAASGPTSDQEALRRFQDDLARYRGGPPCAPPP